MTGIATIHPLQTRASAAQFARNIAAASLLSAFALPAIAAEPAPDYYPGPDPKWESRLPSQTGMDANRLAEAIAFAKTQETDFPADFSAQRRIFGRPLGPLPASRAATNGVILRHGYIVAEWGDTEAVDPVYSIAKSFLSTLAGLAADRGLIDVAAPVRKSASDGYDTAHNAKITWEMHLRQVSEWEGAMWGKPHDFVGETEFGRGQRQPRALSEPGTYWEYNDVRINRLALSLAQVYGLALPTVLDDLLMSRIGASANWRYYGYANSQTVIGGKTVDSVTGGTRWGGGLWISTHDLARFGLLISRGGRWENRQIISAAWLKKATTPGALGPDYGYLWWLNTQGKLYPSAPRSAFAARGAYSNTLVIDPEHDLVVAWRWHRDEAMDEFLRRVIAAVN